MSDKKFVIDLDFGSDSVRSIIVDKRLYGLYKRLGSQAEDILREV